MSTTPDPAGQTPAAEFKVRIANYADDTNVRIERRGTLRFEGDTAVLTGRVPATFLPTLLSFRTATKTIPLNEIFNVAREGARLSFARVKLGVKWSNITLQAANAKEAAAIVERLPTQATPEFFEQRRQHEAFAAALGIATPRAPITPVLIGLNVLVFVAMGLAGVGWFEPDPEQMVAWGADFWPLTTGGEWWRLLTSAFLHFGVIHLAMNMWALGSAGVMVEKLYGNVFYLAIYLFGAVASGLAATWWDAGAISAGASGAVFAVYGALLAYLLFQPDSFPKSAAHSLLSSTLVFVGYNVFYGLSHAGISNSAHLGGLASGFLLGAIIGRPLDLTRRTDQTAHRMALGIGVSLAVLGAGLVLVPKCDFDLKAEEAFRAECRAFSGEEEKAINEYNALIELSRARVLTDVDYAQRLESQVIPAWESLANRFSAIPVSEASPSKPLHAKLVTLCQTRRDACLALSEGLRTGNEQKFKESAALMKQADKLVGEIDRGP
jgi:rhomboid protease GluP